MRIPVIAALVLAAPLNSQAPPPSSLAEDPVLRLLIQEALDHNPELAGTSVLARAERERVSQAGALPDPSLGLGIQNDGFKRIEVGRMETSYYSVTATQPLPWPGKRALRKDVALLEAKGAEASIGRARLGLEADLKRGYLGLLLVRDQRKLLEIQEVFLQQAEALAKTRYEVGQGSQVDLLRAQLERTRLAQARLSLDAEERIALAGLNHMRTLDSDVPLATQRTLESLLDPQPLAADQWEAKAETESPELEAADLGKRQAERGLELAKLERRPDFAVSAGLMPRGGLDPMWALGVSITLPLWSRQKQQRAVAEQEWRQRAQDSQRESVHHRLRQRIHERVTLLESTLASLKLYREGLLVQSEATYQASLAQYEAGRMPFLAVLESLKGWISDRSGLLQTQAQAQSLQIALEEMNLGPTPPIGATVVSAGSTTLASAAPGAVSAKPKQGSGDSGAAPAMGGM